jgi:hypothetical protein
MKEGKWHPLWPRRWNNTAEEPKDVPRVGATFRAHRATRDPGLEALAILYNRFAAKSTCPFGGANLLRLITRILMLKYHIYPVAFVNKSQ